jgi:hypothetical protein
MESPARAAREAGLSCIWCLYARDARRFRFME